MVAVSALRVMIVDDDEEMRKLMRRTLERMGFTQIYTAKDGSEGLDLARSQHPDLIVSDYDMPERHGLQFLKAVRDDPAMASIAFVMLSGVANDAVTQKARELGVNSIITKPFFADDLKQRLGAVIHELTGSRIEWTPTKTARRMNCARP